MRVYFRTDATPQQPLFSYPQEETSMPTIVAYHKVKDQKHWLASPKRKESSDPSA